VLLVRASIPEGNTLPDRVKALEESAPQLDLSNDEQRDVQEIMDWTGKYADLVDPLLANGKRRTEQKSCARHNCTLSKTSSRSEPYQAEYRVATAF
jgi:hypothetical protein